MLVPRLGVLQHQRAQAPWLIAAPLDVDGCSDDDLRNLSYFGVRGALVTPPKGRRSDTGRALVTSWATHLAQTRARLADAGIQAALLAGVSADGLPRRSFDEVWPALDGWGAAGILHGIGPVSPVGGPQTWPLLRQQADIAYRHRLRLWVQLPIQHAVATACQVVQALPSATRPLLGWLNADPADVEALLLLPGLVSVGVSPRRPALQLLHDVPPTLLHASPRLVMGFTSGMTPDVLAMARLDEARAVSGYPDSIGQRRWQLVLGKHAHGCEDPALMATVPA